MMWDYLEPKPGVWDFTLYDALFKAAEKYGVKITPTLVPNNPPFFWGKDYFYSTHNMHMYRTREDRERSEIYIKMVVDRYKNSPALDSWWLYNEPDGYPPDNIFAIEEFRIWLKAKYITINSLNKSWQSYFPSFTDITYDNRWLQGGWVWQAAFYDWCNFGKSNINSQIYWLREAVKKYDTTHLFTTNPPGVFSSLAHYDLPGILGSYMHPSWSFSWVPRDKYGLAVSWQNDLLHGVANERPYWISELQGGSNWYSSQPLDPSPKDIAQWVWTSFGSGANRIIFWLLNPRMQGNESTEWALLDFQQNPSGRMKKAAEIANIMQNNKNAFSNARPISSPITVIISSQTLLMQERRERGASSLAAVKALAHQKAAMACYNALMEQGIPVQIKLISAYDWETKSKDQIVILPDVRSLTMQDINKIKIFVHNGNNAIVIGLTGLYDENEKSWIVNREFPLEEVFGGDIKDILSDSDSFSVKLDGYNNPFPTQLRYSEILPKGGKVVGTHNGKTIAVRNNYGTGSVLWIPSAIGIGAWEYGDKSLAHLLKDETMDAVKNTPFRFDTLYENCYMHTLKTTSGYISVIVNGDSTTKNIHIIPSKIRKSNLLYGNGWDSQQNLLTINPNETVVIKWE